MSSDEDMKEMVGGCCVCGDERGWDENPLVYCDGQGCNVAVHQACYGIVTVPSGPWFCRKCESQERTTRVVCCPSRDGALKRTDQSGWAHVVCALYIPEVRFGNVTTMEPILTSLIPAERFGRPCYICENSGRASKANAGACMQCNKPGCKQTFHVTCAQMQGLLCEEAGNMDNVKYCGYCQYHYGKLKSTRNIKIIPPFRPAANADSPGTSPEKSASKLTFPGDDKLSTTTPSNPVSRNGTPTNAGDYIPAKKMGSSHSISPDIDSSKNLKKKSSNGGHSSGSKSSDSSASSKSSTSASITPKIAQPVLAPATFSTSHSTKSTEDNKEGDKSDSFTGTVSQLNSKNKLGKEGENLSKDDSFTVKLERVDNPLMKGAAHSKKDFSTLQLKEVVTAALDRPMTSSKYDHSSSSGIISGMDSANTVGSISSTSGQSGSSKHSHHGEKPAPPDIKPHVTLTPIPMHREDKEKDTGPISKSKSPVSSTLSFHSSFSSKGSNHGTTPPDPVESTKTPRHSSESPKDLSVMEKSGPPAKRARGGSRDEDRGRKTPTKGRGGGRRGGGGTAYSKRELLMDENSRDELMDLDSSNSSRGGRGGAGRKPTSSRSVGRPMREDPPTPTLSQLKSQMEAGGADSTSTLGVLPTHMFGNALNPASSMAQRMVDTLSQEMEAVAAAGAVGIPDISSPPTPLVGISLPGKSSSSHAVNGNSASLSMNPSGSGSAPPQTLEQLLERQWEQGSQFLMEQAQHLDIAQLLSCLNQLKQDNRALEEHVQSLVQRRDQLIAINARLSIPLGNSSALGPLGPVFNTGGVNVNGNIQNGHGTPPLPIQVLPTHSSVPKGLQVNPSTPSPQHQHQQHELMMQSARHGHRDERMYHSEMQVSRAEITVSHPASSPHGHSHANSNVRQNVAPYGYPGPISHHSHSSHHHPHGRDGSR